MKLRLFHHRDGARIAYREAGVGPSLCLVHSAALSHREFAPVVEDLSDRFRLVQRQVGQHEAKAIGEMLDERDVLAVREPGAVHEAQPRPDARLAVGDPRAVAVVIEAQLHPRASPARRPRASAVCAAGGAPGPSSASCWMRRASWSARPPGARRAPARTAPAR